MALCLFFGKYNAAISVRNFCLFFENKFQNFRFTGLPSNLLAVQHYSYLRSVLS